MKTNDDEAASQRGKERRASVDGTRQHRREDNEQNSIESGLACQGALLTQAHDRECSDQHDYAAQSDMREGKFFRLKAESKERRKRIL